MPLQVPKDWQIDEIALTAALTLCSVYEPPITDPQTKAQIQVAIIRTIKQLWEGKKDMMENQCRETFRSMRCALTEAHEDKHRCVFNGKSREWWPGNAFNVTHWQDFVGGVRTTGGIKTDDNKQGRCEAMRNYVGTMVQCSLVEEHDRVHSAYDSNDTLICTWPQSVLTAEELRENISCLQRNIHDKILDIEPNPNVRHHMYVSIAGCVGVMLNVLDRKPLALLSHLRPNMQFMRISSATPKEGYVEDGIYGGYCESDDTLRARIRKFIGVHSCNDIYIDKSEVHICDRVSGHTGPHKVGEGMSTFQWPRSAEKETAFDVDVRFNGAIAEAVRERHVTGADPVGAPYRWPPINKDEMPPITSPRPAIPPAGTVDAAVDAMADFVSSMGTGQKPIGNTGASSSHAIDVRYEMIPREFVEALGTRFHNGLKHGRFNYRKGLCDKQFILDRTAHMYDHMHRLFQPMPGDEESFLDNIGAVAWGLAFLCEAYAYPEGRAILEDMMRPAPGKQ